MHKVDNSQEGISVVPPRNTLIQPRSLCPCDGGCPRCFPQVKADLKIGQPNDVFEQEADRVAEHVMRLPDSLIQRQPMEKEEEMLQPQESPEQTLERGVGLQQSVNTMRGSGQPLSSTERNYFEPRFGRDLGQVRVHTDDQTACIASGINARAFTVGQDIAFGTGQYKPSTAEGKRLLAHELTHVIQQNGMISREVGEIAPPTEETSSPAEQAAVAQRRIWRRLVFVPLLEAGVAVRESEPNYSLALEKCREAQQSAIDLSLSLDIDEGMRSQI